MQVRMWLDETSKGLRYGHATGADFVVAGGLTSISSLMVSYCESSELPQKLPVAFFHVLGTSALLLAALPVYLLTAVVLPPSAAADAT